MSVAGQETRKPFRARSDGRSSKYVHSFFTVNEPYYVEKAECGAVVTGRSHWKPTADEITCPHCLMAKTHRESQS